MAKKWTNKEIQLLKKMYPHEDRKTLEQTFNRSMAAVTFKANSLNLKRQKYWTKKEEELLKKYYPKLSDSELSNLLDRSIASIRNKASRLSLRKENKNSSSKPWTQEEIKTLKKIYPKTNKNQLEERFQRSMNAIRNKAFQLNLKRKPNKKGPD
ncbi:hypothetical protein [Natranaerobius trueperi]|uniref:Myb-like domain-containing protein n=1 Tax=Natranaerobius trueperi TaxID=759412 RepID=A0A226BZV9_9FIRM|nr:hypothetical protein [Natranaerobius trueperi]OWZ83650.1 hypothetical protein CDO51_07465 [Natranaerobius trueperi]